MPARINELRSGEALDTFLVVTQQREAVTKTGSKYLTLTLVDRTGQVTGRIWKPDATCPDGLTVPGIYWLRGMVENYREELQLNIDALRPYEPAPEQYDALVQASRWPADVLMDELRLHISTQVRSEPLRRLLLAAMDHPSVRERLAVSPAASANHHAYRSGLIEHTLSMMRIGTLLAEHYAAYYPGAVDGDLLIAGALLHDLGKVWELSGDLATEYTTVGKLVGHIPMGATFVAELARELGDIPDELVWELQHLVLSHHGELAFGSPKRPKTLEAQLLHFVDNIDAKTNTFLYEARKPGWTGFLRNFERPLLNPVELRRSWTEPPPGAVSAHGPGGRPAPVEAALADRALQPTAVTVATVHDAETARVPRRGARDAAGSAAAAEKTVQVQAVEQGSEAIDEAPSPEVPATRPLQRTLGIFDGLSDE